MEGIVRSTQQALANGADPRDPAMAVNLAILKTRLERIHRWGAPYDQVRFSDDIDAALTAANRTDEQTITSGIHA